LPPRSEESRRPHERRTSPPRPACQRFNSEPSLRRSRGRGLDHQESVRLLCGQGLAGSPPNRPADVRNAFLT
jgi:hypothetical protein